MHRPVLEAEVLRYLEPRPGGVFVDGTLGDGGHAAGLAARIAPGGRLLALDRDAEAVRRVLARGEDWLERCTVVQGNFANLSVVARAHGFDGVDGVLLDLGVSSTQLEDAERGFSFQRDGPLDMRMDRSHGATAADLVNTLDEEALAQLLRRYGEEPRAWRIARAIVRERARTPFARTVQLADLVTRVCGGRHGRLHQATRTFQALRIAVNDELAALDRALESGLALLKPGGRMAVIAFHSLEDRQVKQCFLRHAGHWESRPAGGRDWVVTPPEVRILTPKPVRPSREEVIRNPRARSARLRVAERKG